MPPEIPALTGIQGSIWKVPLVPAAVAAAAVSLYVPARSTASLLKVATPATALTTVLPISVAVFGWTPSVTEPPRPGRCGVR